MWPMQQYYFISIVTNSYWVGVLWNTACNFKVIIFNLFYIYFTTILCLILLVYVRPNLVQINTNRYWDDKCCRWCCIGDHNGFDGTTDWNLILSTIYHVLSSSCPSPSPSDQSHLRGLRSQISKRGLELTLYSKYTHPPTTNIFLRGLIFQKGTRGTGADSIF